MAKNDSTKELFKLMRAAGLRKKVAAEISASGAKRVRQAAEDFGALAARLEDHVGPERRKAPTPQRRTKTATRRPAPRRQSSTGQ